MNYRFIAFCFVCSFLLLFAACAKWQDTPGKNLGLTTKYCNNPVAINYNQGYPGIEDSTSCIFPTDPFVGNYSFQDSVYTNVDTSVSGALINFSISANSRSSMKLNDFCSSGNQLYFTANRYYHAISDTIIGAGTQLMCRTLDTLSGTMDYRPSDSSIYLEFMVVSDTGISTHKGRAYKK